MSRRWVGAQFGWVMAWIWVNLAVFYFFHSIARLSTGLGGAYRILVMGVALIVQTGMLRSLIKNDAKPVRMIWGSLALLLWGVLCLIAAEMQDYLTNQILKWLLAWVLAPAIFFPFAAASSVWGWRLPWRRVFRVVCSWRWWLAILLGGAVGDLAETYFDRVRGYPYVWDVDLTAGLKMGAVDLLEMAVWVLLLGWLATLFDMDGNNIKRTGGDPTALLLSESGSGAGGEPLDAAPQYGSPIVHQLAPERSAI